MVLTQWFAQGRSGPDSYGILMAAEAQPDGTVGRRRFFRGSFLFDPSTEDVGAGFKHFRPLRHDKQTDSLVAYENHELTPGSGFAPFSMQQYELSKEAFYDRMDALIDPQPLDPNARLSSLVDAFEESVRRRVIAVDNGERFMAERNFGPLEMPVGHELFETTGPWEDFSTPSRDLRLLISLDTVLSFPNKVATYPERYRLANAAAAKQVAHELRAELDRQLGSRTIEDVRSDGNAQSLTLKQVAERGQALEAGYNPNDCIERRWGATEGTQEMASCRRRAPAEQQRRMESYRVWFATRVRPHRGVRAP
jgi:hypothetical protein